MKRLIFRRFMSGILKFSPLIAVVFLFNPNTFGTPQNSPAKSGLKLYISTVGNDSWSGKLSEPNPGKTDGPFATLWGARDAIRLLKASGKLPKGNVIVEVQGGTYEMPRSFDLESGDGGTDSLSKIIYSGHMGSEVRLSGGKNLTGWEPVSDPEILKKLSPGARGKVYQSDLRAAGISDFGSPGGGGMELFFDDKPMWISRYPNTGFVKITGLYNIDPVDVRGTKGDQTGKFNYDDPRISSWKDEKDAWVHGYWFWDWSAERHKIANLDTEKKFIEVVPPYHHYGYRLGQWFYGFNLLMEIDEPGEYYIDREKGVLYFYPPSDIEKAHTYVTLNKNIITLNQVPYLTIQGLILEGCRETVVSMKDCSSSLVAGCVMRNSGDWGVKIDGGMQNGVTGCDIYNLGAGGVRISAGDRKTLVPGNCFSDNNNIHHTARIQRIYNPCVSLYGAGNRATHNVMEHVPHMAIYFDGNDHLIEYNDINDVCYESNDAGAIYAGRNWTMRGNKIRYNYLHNISGFEGKGCVGIYLDDSFSSADIIGNVFNNVTRAMMIGGGRDNNVLNNIFIDCVPSLHVDARALGWMKYHADDWIREAGEKGTILGIAWNKPPYSIKYPKLPGILNDEPLAPKGNIISNNICAGGNWDKASGFWGMSIEDIARPYLTMADNIVAPGSGVQDSLSKSFLRADPLFTDPGNPESGKFQLAAGSPALKHGFKQIPFEKIGLYQSKYRALLPVEKGEETGNAVKLTRANSFWGLHFDRHLGLTDSHIGATLTEGMIDSLLNIARPDYIQVDCKGHPGVSSYPTEVGQQAASYDKDPLALLRKVTDAHNTGLYVHYSGVKDANYVRLHPEQARVQQDGKPDPENTSLWGDYSEKLLIPQLKEIALKYKVDGAWVDGESWAVEPDFRPDVLAEFRKQTGIELNPAEPGSSANYRLFLEFNRQKFISYLRNYCSEVHKAAPDFQICSNWAFSGMMPDPVPDDIGLDFFSGDYDPGNSLNIANWHARALSGQGIAFDLMAWSFTHDFAKGVSIPKTSLQLCQEAAPVISLGGGIQAYFRQNADISFQPAAFRIMKELGDFVIPRRDFCKGISIIPQVALLYSTSAWKESVDVVYKSTGVSKIQGILNALLDGQSSVEVLMTGQFRKRLSSYPVVVIPEWKAIEPDLEKMLKEYVFNGGNLLIIGATATAPFDELLGVKQKAAPVKLVRNICMGDRFAAVMEDVRTVEYLAGTVGLSTLYTSADLLFPAETAATVRSYGKGKVAGIYLDFGNSYLINTSPVIRDLMASVIGQLFHDPIIKIEGSHKVNVVPTTKNGKLLIQLVNTSGDHANPNVKGIDEIPALLNLKLSVSTKNKPESVVLQPEGIALKYSFINGRTEIIIPKLEIHSIIEINPI